MIVRKSYLIEVNVNQAPAVGNSYTIPQNIGELLNATIYGIEVYSAGDIAASPLNKVPVSLAGCRSAVLTVYNEKNIEQVRQVPLINLIPTSQGGLQREFLPFKWNPNKSKITLVSAANVNLNESFVLNIIYV